MVGKLCVRVIVISSALFGSSALSFAQDRFGSAIEVFLEDEGVLACEYEVEVAPSARARSGYLARSLTFVANMLQRPVFLPRREVLPADPFKLQFHRPACLFL
jgi:hypothetical protein